MCVQKVNFRTQNRAIKKGHSLYSVFPSSKNNPLAIIVGLFFTSEKPGQ